MMATAILVTHQHLQIKKLFGVIYMVNPLIYGWNIAEKIYELITIQEGFIFFINFYLNSIKIATLNN